MLNDLSSVITWWNQFLLSWKILMILKFNRNFFEIHESWLFLLQYDLRLSVCVIHCQKSQIRYFCLVSLKINSMRAHPKLPLNLISVLTGCNPSHYYMPPSTNKHHCYDHISFGKKFPDTLSWCWHCHSHWYRKSPSHFEKFISCLS